MNRIENLHSNVFSQRNVELFEKNIMFLADDVIAKYVKTLDSNKIKATIRKSRGQDIDAACGQLANKS